MVTSLIPTYSLNADFHREFRSFRVSRAVPPAAAHIVPVHEFSRVSLQERRAALRAAFAPAAPPTGAWAASDGRAVLARCDTLRERRAALEAAFQRNSEKQKEMVADAAKKEAARRDIENNNIEKNNYKNRIKKDDIISLEKLNSKPVNKERVYAKVQDARLEQRGDIRNDTYAAKFMNFKKPTKKVDRSIVTDSESDAKSERVYRSRAIITAESLNDITSKKEHSKYAHVVSHESMTDIRTGDALAQCAARVFKKTADERRRLAQSGNGTRILTTEEPITGSRGRRGWATPDSGVALGDSPPEDSGDLPSIYLGLSQWTPKSTVFQNKLREHEWSISYV